MVQFALDYLRDNGATTVSLTDKSTIECNGVEVELGPMSFLKYGMTWYEKYFGFQPAPRFQKMYIEAKNRREQMLQTELLSTQPCDFYDFETINDIFAYIGFVNFHSIEWTRDL